MGDEHGGGSNGEADLRTNWMRARVLSALRCKDEKFDKLLTGEEAGILHSFLDSDLTRIIIFDNGKGDLTAVRTHSITRHALHAGPGRPHGVCCASGCRGGNTSGTRC